MSSKQIQTKNNVGKKLSETVPELLKKTVNSAALIFTVICVAICTIGVVSKSKEGLGVSSEVVLWIALFCLLVGVVNSITDVMKSKKVNSVITWTVHFILCYASFFLIFISGDIFNASLAGSSATQGNGWFRAFVLTFLFVGAYAVVIGIRFVIYAAASKIRRRSEAYQNIYTDAQEK